MALAPMWRLFLAAAIVVAMQSSLLHPFQHFQGLLGAKAAGIAALKAIDEQHPVESPDAKLCEVCVAGAALGAAASASSVSEPVLSSGGFAALRGEGIFFAAFTPLFRSQAPPAVL
jgi:hypothetical protein